MKKNQNGVTMTILVVTIIVLTILLSVTMNVSTDLLSDTKIKSYISEMLLVQARVKSMGETFEFEGIINSSTGIIDTSKSAQLGYPSEKIGTKVDSLPGAYTSQVSNEAKNDPGKRYWYTWNANTLAANGFDSDMITSGQQYYVNYKTGEVIYSKGYSPLSNKSVTLYSLQNMINYK